MKRYFLVNLVVLAVFLFNCSFISPPEKANVASVGSAVNCTVRVVILDNYGEPVIGATVVAKGKPNTGTTSDIDGKAIITIPNGTAELVVSYVGMTFPVTVVVCSNTQITIIGTYNPE